MRINSMSFDISNHLQKLLVTAAARAATQTATVAAAALMSLAPACAQVPAIDEVKIGVLYHDVPGLWSGFNAERATADANVEVLMAPWLRPFGGILRPALGATVNFNRETSKAYADVRWEKQTPTGIFFGLGLGLAVHNGTLDLSDDGRKALGSRVLMHPSAELGYRWNGRDSVALFADHMSNGYSRRHNEGMDSIGLRYGHKFGSASASDDTPAAAGTANFTGWYVGAAGGVQSASGHWDGASETRRGAAFTGLAGYNWQSGQAVFGLEVDATAPSSELKATCSASGVSCKIAMPGLFSIRPRAGWVIDNTLFYATGGLALAAWDDSASSAAGVRLVTTKSINHGVALGIGIDHKLTSQLVTRAEVLHYGIYGKDLTVPGIGVTSPQLQNTVGRIGLSWAFN
jgi:lipid A 3-O-deacylase